MSGSRTDDEGPDAAVRAALAQLAEHIALGDGFQVHMIVSDHADQVLRAIRYVAARVEARRGAVHIERLSPYAKGQERGALSLTDLAPVVIEPLVARETFAAANTAGALIVVIDAVAARPAHEMAWHNAFRRMNEIRNRIRAHVPGALIVCVPPWLEAEFVQSAADLWSWRRAVIALPAVREPVREESALADDDLSVELGVVLVDQPDVHGVIHPFGALDRDGPPIERVREPPATTITPSRPTSKPPLPVGSTLGPPAPKSSAAPRSRKPSLARTAADWPSLSILHLADLQISEKLHRVQRHKFLAFLDDLRGRRAAGGGDIDLICVAGDIGYSGKAEEYELAERWFLDPLVQVAGVPRERVLWVPGNHDVDRRVIERAPNLEASMVTSLAELEQADQTLTSAPERRHVMKRLHNFVEFTNRFFGQDAPEGEIYFTRTLDIRGTRIGIAGLNTALLRATHDDDHGDDSMVLGQHQVEQALAEIERADLRIALLHHPVHALADRDRVGELFARFDLVLHGHVRVGGDTDTDRDDDGDLAEVGPIAAGHTVYCGAPPLLKDKPLHAYAMVVLGADPHVEIRQFDPAHKQFVRRAWRPLNARRAR